MALTYTELTLEMYNKDLFNLLKNVEGAKKNAYLDTAGLPTIGIGFNIKGNPDNNRGQTELTRLSRTV